MLSVLNHFSQVIFTRLKTGPKPGANTGGRNLAGLSSIPPPRQVHVVPIRMMTNLLAWRMRRHAEARFYVDLKCPRVTVSWHCRCYGNHHILALALHTIQQLWPGVLSLGLSTHELTS